MKHFHKINVLVILFFLIINLCEICCQSVSGNKIKFIDYYFEGASPLLWKIENDTILGIALLPDYQRQTLNRQTDHWYFKIVAVKGTRIRMEIEKMLPDVYNGRLATDWWNYKTGIPCYISYDNKNWESFKTKTLPGNELYCDFVMKEDEVYVARLPVYTTTHLKDLLDRLSGLANINILNIGRTLDNRPLEIIQLGNPNAEIQVVIRARVHPWEPGGNWVVEGFVDEFIRQTTDKLQENLCFNILPMANKDGVVRGMTRFNTAGMDLNRNMDKASDSSLCPENLAFEKFIESLIAKGNRPALVMDLHNDDKGDIHLAKRDRSDIQFQKNMKRFENLMREHTSFSESFRYLWNDDGQAAVMTIENGLLHRYGLEALVYELNANWITGLGKIPSANDWIETGRGLLHVMNEYFVNY